MIGYATLRTNNIGKACVYYDALLATIGANRSVELGE
jgi:hypothetical protein